MSEYLLYIENGKNYLVDTGSPFSIHYGSSQMGNTIGKLYPGMLEELTENLKIEVTGLIGTDQLMMARWHFNPENSKLSRLSDEFDLSGYKAYLLGQHLTLPVIEVKANGESHKLIIDTCSTLNYLKGNLLSGEMVSTVEDYHPMLGNFTTHGHTYSLEAFEKKSEVLFYDIPQMMEMTLGSQIQGILGCGFMSSFEWVIDLDKHTWWMKI
jgi:hypothetical protein